MVVRVWNTPPRFELLPAMIKDDWINPSHPSALLGKSVIDTSFGIYWYDAFVHCRK